MTLKASVVLAFFAGIAVGGVTSVEEANPCSKGGVKFQGYIVFESKLAQLSDEAVLEIEVSEEVPSGAESKAAVFQHDVPLRNYKAGEELTYSFCADLKSLKSKRISVKGRIIESADDTTVEYIGETVVTGGSDSYEADLSLAMAAKGGPRGEPSVADCEFGPLENLFGIAVKAYVDLGIHKTLPTPTYLYVTLQDLSSQSGEPEVVSVFYGDISAIHNQGSSMAAFLCAKTPAIADPLKHSVEAIVHIGWDGFPTSRTKTTSPREGDLLTKDPTPLVVVPGKSDYSVKLEVKPYYAEL